MTKLASTVMLLLGSYACAAEVETGEQVTALTQAIVQPPVFLEQPGSGQQLVGQAGLNNFLWVGYDTDDIGFVNGVVTNFTRSPAWVGLYLGIKCGDAPEYEWTYWEEVVEPHQYRDPPEDDIGDFRRFVFCPPNVRTAGAIYVESDVTPDED